MHLSDECFLIVCDRYQWSNPIYIGITKHSVLTFANYIKTFKNVNYVTVSYVTHVYALYYDGQESPCQEFSMRAVYLARQSFLIPGGKSVSFIFNLHIFVKFNDVRQFTKYSSYYIFYCRVEPYHEIVVYLNYATALTATKPSRIVSHVLWS